MIYVFLGVGDCGEGIWLGVGVGVGVMRLYHLPLFIKMK